MSFERFDTFLPIVFNSLKSVALNCNNGHCVKSVLIRSFSGPNFPEFGLNTDQKNSEYGHFSRCGQCKIKNRILIQLPSYMCTMYWCSFQNCNRTYVCFVDLNEGLIESVILCFRVIYVLYIKSTMISKSSYLVCSKELFISEDGNLAEERQEFSG